jgi:hypothetical protein
VTMATYFAVHDQNDVVIGIFVGPDEGVDSNVVTALGWTGNTVPVDFSQPVGPGWKVVRNGEGKITGFEPPPAPPAP